MAQAPFFQDVAIGPPEVRASWVRTRDGLRLRAVAWPGGGRGSVLIFTGRGECAEKYGRVAQELLRAGFSAVTVDWRGQGLSDREPEDRLLGHVAHFADYQHDVAALLAHAQAEDLPKPYFLLAHSMGSAIGLRTLLERAPIRAAALGSPMWGIKIPAWSRPVVQLASWAAGKLGQGHRYAPGTLPQAYVISHPFEDNALTTDPEYFAYLRRQIATHPELELGGPGLSWLHAALAECRFLARAPAPGTPTLVLAAGLERVVAPEAIPRRVANWPSAQLETVPEAEHEVFMERPEIRQKVFARTLAFFGAHL